FQLNSSYWTDEILALQKSFRLSLLQVITTFLGDTHHPLYSVFARVSLLMFGEAPWALRLPAVLFGVMAIAMTYVVARLAVRRREALFASLLLAVSYHHVWFSQNARGYTLIGLLALLTTWTLIRLLQQPTWRLAAAYALCAALGAYTHLTMVFVAIGQALVAVVAMARPQAPWYCMRRCSARCWISSSTNPPTCAARPRRRGRSAKPCAYCSPASTRHRSSRR